MKKTQVGTVVSDKMQNTAVVEVALWKIHRIIKKRYKRHQRFMAHNPENTYKVGDKVEIVETKPLSKNKRWEITRKVEVK
jgi:small subunit ribosomal protein S17